MKKTAIAACLFMGNGLETGGMGLTMIKRMRLSVAILIMFPFLLCAEQVGVTETIQKRSVIRVGVRLQEASKIIVHLHGYGDNAQNNALLSTYMIDTKTDAFIIPVATHKMREGAYSWFNKDNSDAEKVIERLHLLLNEIRKQNPDAYLVLGGFSQGAIISLHLSARKDMPVDAVYIWSGGHPPKSYPNPEIMPPIFMSHGKNDAVLPIAPMKKTADTLKKLSVAVTWYPYDAQHNLSKELFSATKEFIIETKKSMSQKRHFDD